MKITWELHVYLDDSVSNMMAELNKHVMLNQDVKQYQKLLIFDKSASKFQKVKNDWWWGEG